MPVRPKLVATFAVVALAAAACGSSATTRSASAGSGAPSAPTTAMAGGATTATTAMAGSPATSAASPAATIGGLHSASVPVVGTVLVDGAGRTVYLFEPDARSKPTCSGPCAAVWPPVAGSITVGSGVQASLVGKVSGPNGEQATYNGWPLYTFVKDTAAGQAHGQGVHGFGGYWYALTPAGSAVAAGASTPPPTTSSSAAPTQSGAGGYSYGSGGSSSSGGY